VRHSFIARLGAADTAKIPTRAADQVTNIQLIEGKERLDHGLGDALDYLSSHGFSPSESAIDLLVLAALLTAADTRIKRSANAEDGWTREIDLHLPVASPKTWTSLADLLEKTLSFLTGDLWRLRFRKRPAGFEELAPGTEKLAIYQPTSVCLLSGGLDSFIGAVDLLSAGKKPIFVSHYWDSTTSAHQRMCIHRLEKRFGAGTFLNLRVRVGFGKKSVAKGTYEDSLRGRSFLFFALAAAVADCIDGKSVIYVPENGLISLNVPLDTLRLGAFSTRTTHPYYMARWNDLLKGLSIAGTLENPYRFQTKGEMMSGSKDRAFLKKCAKETMSCSHPVEGRWRRESPGHCGRCVPCIIRRAAFEVGFGADDTYYKVRDLTANPLNSLKAEGADIRSFQVGIARLKKNPGIEKRLIYQPGPLVDYPDADIKRYAAVYKNGMAEVERVLKGVKCKPL
jgi:7-cyano-7-deazaguanine synthase in queuosine biosynthesis